MIGPTSVPRVCPLPCPGCGTPYCYRPQRGVCKDCRELIKLGRQARELGLVLTSPSASAAPRREEAARAGRI